MVVGYRVGWPDQMFIHDVRSDIHGKLCYAKIPRMALISVGPVLGEVRAFKGSALYDLQLLMCCARKWQNSNETICRQI